MNHMMAAAFFGSVVFCGAEASAADTDLSPSTSLTNPQAIHKKLMKDCVEQQKSQSGAVDSDVRKSCQIKVKDQMQQMNDAGTLSPSSVPDRSPGSPDSQCSSQSDPSGH
jgi:hypothetical protein